MLKRIGAILIFSMTLNAYSQSTSKYQIATIVEVKTHQAQDPGGMKSTSYDVSLKMGATIYTVLYTPPFDIDTVKYKTGRDLLVLVGAKTITYNDLLGQSVEVPIISQRPADQQLK